MNTITFQNAYQTSQSPYATVGERASTPDGRDWVYAKASSPLAKGQAAVPAAVTAAAATLSSSTDIMGRIVYIQKVGAAWTPGAFAGGWVEINAGTGTGQSAKIVANSATQLTLAPETALTTALDGTSTAAIWTQFLVTPSAITSKIQNATGIAQTAFATNDYGYLLTRGQGTVIATTTLTVGAGFSTGGATAGQVIPMVTATGSFDAQTLGVCIVANSAANLGALVFVTLDA